MTPAEWVSQTVPPLGAITSEGIRQALGRPSMSRLTVLLREAAQNSWDAKDENRRGPVDFSIELKRLDGEQLNSWRKLVGASAPADHQLPLRSALEDSDTALVMFVSDRGTTGLGGPTRADDAKGKVRDYAAFVLNIGEPRDKDLGGGTYGFGKSIFFTSSRAHTIIISSRCEGDEGTIESRLVGCALGHSFSDGERNFTGRHWWGVRSNADEVVEPLTGERADRTAMDLGLPGFEPGTKGTTVAVLCPELDGRSPQSAAEWLSEAALWHLWPKLIRVGGDAPEMTVTVSVDGHPVPTRPPREHPAVRLFADAFDAQVTGHGVEMLACKKPRQDVGRLSIVRTLAPLPFLDDVALEAGIEAPLRHVCLMRAANLVVKYLEGPPTGEETVPYAGVFKPISELDDAFARSEPPTHDDWVPDQLDGHERTFVRQTFFRINEALRAFAAPAPLTVDRTEAEPLGGASRLFAGLLGPTGGLGASPRGNERGASGGGRRPVRLEGPPRWGQLNGADVLLQDVLVETTRAVTVRAGIAVSVWGSSGSESDPPAGADAPRFIGWVDPNGNVHGDQVIAFAASENSRWQIAAEPPADAAVTFSVRQAPRSGES